jgi:hypothetical protein
MKRKICRGAKIEWFNLLTDTAVMVIINGNHGTQKINGILSQSGIQMTINGSMAISGTMIVNGTNIIRAINGIQDNIIQVANGIQVISIIRVINGIQDIIIQKINGIQVIKDNNGTSGNSGIQDTLGCEKIKLRDAI